MRNFPDTTGRPLHDGVDPLANDRCRERHVTRCQRLGDRYQVRLDSVEVLPKSAPARPNPHLVGDKNVVTPEHSLDSRQ